MVECLFSRLPRPLFLLCGVLFTFFTRLCTLVNKYPTRPVPELGFGTGLDDSLGEGVTTWPAAPSWALIQVPGLLTSGACASPAFRSLFWEVLLNKNYSSWNLYDLDIKTVMVTNQNHYCRRVCDWTAKSIHGSSRVALGQSSRTSWGPLMRCTPQYPLGTAPPHSPATWVVVFLEWGT